MTKKEAISELTRSIGDITSEASKWLNVRDQRYISACSMAITALSREIALDEIRDKIETHRRKVHYIDPYDTMGDCLDIIDETIKESEVIE